MKRITAQNYRTDKYYDRVVRATRAILDRQIYISPIDLFVAMDLLDIDAVRRWRAGQIPFLEQSIRCNLAVASRILRILRLHAHDLDLRPSSTVYRRRSGMLRFTNFGDSKLEEAYARHFVQRRLTLAESSSSAKKVASSTQDVRSSETGSSSS